MLSQKGCVWVLKWRPPRVVAPVSYKESQMVIKNPHIESISGVKNLGRPNVQKLFLNVLVNLKCPIWITSESILFFGFTMDSFCIGFGCTMWYNNYEISELLEVEMHIKHNFFNGLVYIGIMASVAQLVRAQACGAWCRGFESHRSPQKRSIYFSF